MTRRAFGMHARAPAAGAPHSFAPTQVINFYLGLLQHRQLEADGKQPRVHFHSTFFYNKLFRDEHVYNFKPISRRARTHVCPLHLRCNTHSSVRLRRWTTEKRLEYRILDCDLIVVPIHQARCAAPVSALLRADGHSCRRCTGCWRSSI